jgi:hypothetical protein
MISSQDNKRIRIFLLFTFGIAWASALVIYFNGGLTESQEIIEGTGIKLALTAGVYMFAPAIANVLTRRITNKGWKDTRLPLKVKGHGWTWFLAWLLPGILVTLGAGICFLVFPGHFDPQLACCRL